MDKTLESFRRRLIETNIKMASAKGCVYEDVKTSILVGFVAYKIGNRGIWMPQLLVHNGYRGQGVGSDLLEYLVKRGNNMGKLFIDTIVNERADLGWLKHNKFVAANIEKGYFNENDGIYFRKML